MPTRSQTRAIRDALQIIPLAAVAHTVGLDLIAANDGCIDVLKLEPDKIYGRRVREFVPPLDRHQALEAAQSLLQNSSPLDRASSSLRRLISGDGQELTCWMHVGLATIAGYRCFIACIDLVNPVLSDAHRWRHRAEHDELTGLRRRGALLNQVADWMRTRRPVLLAFLDIDNFKAINDTHGHAAGDHVLTTLARRLEQHSPVGCTVSRLSGDEFVLAHPISDLGPRPRLDETRYQLATDRLLDVGRRCSAEPIAWNDHLLMISISVGVTISEPDEEPNSLLSRADNAMYAQKSLVDRRR